MSSMLRAAVLELRRVHPDVHLTFIPLADDFTKAYFEDGITAIDRKIPCSCNPLLEVPNCAYNLDEVVS